MACGQGHRFEPPVCFIPSTATSIHTNEMTPSLSIQITDQEKELQSSTTQRANSMSLLAMTCFFPRRGAWWVFSKKQRSFSVRMPLLTRRSPRKMLRQRSRDYAKKQLIKSAMSLLEISLEPEVDHHHFEESWTKWRCGSGKAMGYRWWHESVPLKLPASLPT